MLNLINAQSDVSKTNQIRISDTPEVVAEKLFLYLYQQGKGVESFNIRDWFSREATVARNKKETEAVFRNRHKKIKLEIQKRLEAYGEKADLSTIQYFLSPGDGNVFFLSPNNKHSGWKQLFCEKWNSSNKERIFNLIFKFYLLSQNLPAETLNGFEELIFIHSKFLPDVGDTNKEGKKSRQKGDSLYVWGQTVFVEYNYHNVLTVKLSRKHLSFLTREKYVVLDGDELGELLIHNERSYYFERYRDARRSNTIFFMSFDSNDSNYEKFKHTQLFHYHNLVNQLTTFLGICNISFAPLDFQTDHFLENPFIKNIASVSSLEIINNTGDDLTVIDRKLLQNYLKYLGVSTLTFFANGKTIGLYRQVSVEGDDAKCWEIQEVIPWDEIVLDKAKNYLVFNRELESEAGSMAYQREDGLWSPTSSIHGKSRVDFYSMLKRKFSFVDTGEFFSTQGINLSKFQAIRKPNKKSNEDTASLLLYDHARKKIDKEKLYQDAQPFTAGQYLELEDLIIAYLASQNDAIQIDAFLEKHNIKLSPEFQKVMIELGVKNWIKENIVQPQMGLPINPQSFTEQRLFAIYVRSPLHQEDKVVAVEFIYKEGQIYLKGILRNKKEIIDRFPFLKTRKSNSNKLINDQEYFVDDENQIYISCYTDDTYTPTLIGRPDILESMKAGILEINRQAADETSSRLLPLVSYYSGEIKPLNRINNMICLDLKNPTFIQYYVPAGKGLEQKIKKGFRVYHLIGKAYGAERKDISTSELIAHPITALHFSTLTQNILKISENSQASLLQKIAKVLVEN